MVDVLYVSETLTQHDQRFISRWKSLGKSVATLFTSKIEQEEFPFEVCKAIEAHNPLLIQAGPLPNLPLGVLESWNGPLLSVSWGFDLLGPKLENDRNYKASVEKSLRMSSGVLVDTRASFKIAVNLGANPNKTYYLPWGVDEIFLSRAQDIEKSTKRKSTDLIFFTARSHEPIYNVEQAILSFLEAGISGSTLLVAGNGSQSKNLKYLAESHSRDGINIEFLGAIDQNQMYEVLSISDFYISAASVDGSSVTLLEAMAMGVVVITPSIVGNLEWVDSQVGFLFDLQSNGLVEVIRHAASIRSTENYQLISANAKSRARNRANWQRNSKILASVFDELVEGNLA
jgi:glycosyltransferase involved in cell wall biosynthesis